MCDTYALAMLDTHPNLRLGVADGGMHFFVHDDEYAYDSIGKHPLPYNGVNGDFDVVEYDQRRDD